MTASTPSLTDAMVELLRSYSDGLRVALPARVGQWSASDPTVCTAQPTVRLVRRASNGARVSFLPRALGEVPVSWPGAGDYAITWPLSEGDTGVLLFADRSIDEWFVTGNPDNTPETNRVHHLTDAVFVPGLRSINGLPSKLVSASDLVVGAPAIQLGSSDATQWVAIADKVLTRLNDIETKFNTHTHLYAPGPGTPVPTAVSVPQVTPSVLLDLRSLTVRSE